MNDIVDTLGGFCTDYDGSPIPSGADPMDGLHCDVLYAAMKEIISLRSELANARNALRPFAESDMRFAYETGHCESEDSCVAGVCDFTVGDLLRAADALKAEGESGT